MNKPRQKIYLALVSRDFEISDDVVDYFKSKGIDILKHSKSLGILHLKAQRDISNEQLEYVEHIEVEREVIPMEEEE